MKSDNGSLYSSSNFLPTIDLSLYTDTWTPTSSVHDYRDAALVVPKQVSFVTSLAKSLDSVAHNTVTEAIGTRSHLEVGQVPDAASFCINDPLSKVSIGRSTFLFQLRLGLSRFKLLLSNGYSSIVDHGTSSIVVKFLSLSLPLLFFHLFSVVPLLGLGYTSLPLLQSLCRHRDAAIDVGRLRSRCSVLWGSRYNAERSYWVR